MSKLFKFLLMSLCFLMFIHYLGVGAANGQKVFKVGIASFGRHPSVDASVDGFKDALKEAGYVEGKNLEYELLLANWDIATANTIARTFKEKKKDLVYSLCTPVTQAVAKQITDFPVVFGMVTDPVGAGVIKSLERPGTNITGATDKADVAGQFKLFKKLVPELKRLGFPYNPAEANDVAVYNIAKQITQDMGIELIPVAVSTSAEVRLGVQNLVGRTDGIYIPSSNVVNVAVGAVIKICSDNKIPLFGNDPDTVKEGAFASYGVSYYGVGRNAGMLAARVLKGENPSDIPVSNPKNFETHLNLKAAKLQGVSIPEDVIKDASVVYR